MESWKRTGWVNVPTGRSMVVEKHCFLWENLVDEYTEASLYSLYGPAQSQQRKVPGLSILSSSTLIAAYCPQITPILMLDSTCSPRAIFLSSWTPLGRHLLFPAGSCALASLGLLTVSSFCFFYSLSILPYSLLPICNSSSSMTTPVRKPHSLRLLKPFLSSPLL